MIIKWQEAREGSVSQPQPGHTGTLWRHEGSCGERPTRRPLGGAHAGALAAPTVAEIWLLIGRVLTVQDRMYGVVLWSIVQLYLTKQPSWSGHPVSEPSSSAVVTNPPSVLELSTDFKDEYTEKYTVVVSSGWKENHFTFRTSVMSSHHLKTSMSTSPHPWHECAYFITKCTVTYTWPLYDAPRAFPKTQSSRDIFKCSQETVKRSRAIYALIFSLASVLVTQRLHARQWRHCFHFVVHVLTNSMFPRSVEERYSKTKLRLVLKMWSSPGRLQLRRKRIMKRMLSV